MSLLSPRGSRYIASGGPPECATMVVIPEARPPAIADASMRRSRPPSGQRENDHRRRARASEEARHDAGRRRDVLLALDLIADDAAADRASGIEAVQRLAVPRIDDQEVVVQVASEKHVARRRRDAGDQWRRPLDAPAHLAGRNVDRLQPALRLVARVGIDRAAVVVRV